MVDVSRMRGRAIEMQNRTQNINCCRDCKERFVACHDVCEKYLKEKAINDARKDKIRENKSSDLMTRLYINEAVKRNKRK